MNNIHPMQLERDLSAAVLVFPLAQCSGMVRSTAAALERLPANEASAFWQATVKGQRTRLQALNMAESDINLEIKGFFDAVEMALAERFVQRVNGEFLRSAP